MDKVQRGGGGVRGMTKVFGHVFHNYKGFQSYRHENPKDTWAYGQMSKFRGGGGPFGQCPYF